MSTPLLIAHCSNCEYTFEHGPSRNLCCCCCCLSLPFLIEGGLEDAVAGEGIFICAYALIVEMLRGIKFTILYELSIGLLRIIEYYRRMV